MGFIEQKQSSFVYVQCRYCGNIYYLEQDVSIDEFIIDAECPECGYEKALNCGENRDDIYYYMDTTLDPRFYLYSHDRIKRKGIIK